MSAPAAEVDWQGPPRQPCPACGPGSRDRTLADEVAARVGAAI